MADETPKPDDWSDWLRHKETVRVRDAVATVIEAQMLVLLSQAFMSSDPKVVLIAADIRAKREFLAQLSPKKQEDDDDEDDEPEDSS